MANPILKITNNETDYYVVWDLERGQMSWWWVIKALFNGQYKQFSRTNMVSNLTNVDNYTDYDIFQYIADYTKNNFIMLDIITSKYIDIKYKCMDGFKLITLTDDEYFVKDRTLDFNNRSIYNGFIVSKPNNKILMNCINNISKNVKNRDYCDSALSVSGPILLARNMTPGQIKKIILKYSSNGLNILLKNKVILTIYDDYRIEQTNFQNNLHYGILWLNKNIYN